MNKITALGIALLAFLGLFSFASAATVYSQPTGTFTATTTIRSTFSTSGLRSATWTATVASVMANAPIFWSVGVASPETFFACIYDTTVAASVGCTDTDIQTGTGSVVYTESFFPSVTSPLTVGHVYQIIWTTQNLGPYDASKLTDSLGNPYVIVFDASGGTPPPNWGAVIVAPALDFGAIQYVATSTSLFSGDASGTLQAIANQCSETGNVFSLALCRAFSYLFIPNPTVLNQYLTIGPTLQDKFPVSWFYQLQTEINTVSTTTLSSPVWTMNLHDIGVGSTTSMGNIMPNMIVFSSSTVKHYITDSQWNALMTLAGAAIWLIAFYTLYGIGNRLFTGHKNV